MSRHTMKKDYLMFVTVTFIILLTYIRRSACKTQLLLAHNPRCGYSADKLFKMNTTTPFLFDRNKKGAVRADWKEFMEQNHSYVDPAYLSEQWNLDPPEKVFMKFTSYYDSMDGNYAVSKSVMSIAFNSTGKTPTNWLDGERVVGSPVGPIQLIITTQYDMLHMVESGSLVGGDLVVSDIRKEENNQMVWLILKPDAHSPLEVPWEGNMWTHSRDRVVLESFKMTPSDDELVIHIYRCVAGIDVSYENLTSDQSATVTLDIFISHKTHMWTRHFTSNQTRHRIDFLSVVCPENVTVLRSAGPLSEINIQLLDTAGLYNRAYFLKVIGYYNDDVKQPTPTATTMEPQEQASPNFPPGTTSNSPTTTPVRVTTTNPPTTTPVHVTTTNPPTTTPVHVTNTDPPTTTSVPVTTPEPVTVSGTTSKPLICVNSNWNTEVNSSALPALLKEIAELKQQLAVNKSQLTSTIRRKISVPDKRVSSQVLGYAAGLILGVLAVLLVVSDIPVIVKTLKVLKNNVFGN